MKTSSPLCTILSQGCSLPSKVTVMVNLVFVTHAYLNSYFCILGRRQWHPTPVFFPGESQGQQGLVGCRLWGRTESDMTEAT